MLLELLIYFLYLLQLYFKIFDILENKSYYFLSKAMDTHHLGNKSYTVKEALSKIKSNCLVIGISSDILFPISEQRFLAEHIEGASWQIIDSNYGHDGFLLEFDAITTAIKDWQNDIKTINI